MSTRFAPKSVLADVECDIEQRLATVRLAEVWKTAPTDREISETALHEITHIFLFTLKTLTGIPSTSEEDILSEEHRIINVMERLLSNMSPLGPRNA